jgi:Domain of unknown function (DUF5655)
VTPRCGDTATQEEFFRGRAESRRIFEALHAAIAALGPAELRVTKSQVAFLRSPDAVSGRRRAFAWAWMPDLYLGPGHAPLVLTVGLKHRDPSPRWKQVVEPAPGRFTHHLELHAAKAIDDQVRAWLVEAWQAAA